MNIENQVVENPTVELVEAEVVQPNVAQPQTVQGKSSSLKSMLMSMFCVVAGLGVGLAVIFAMNEDGNNKRSARRDNSQQTFMEWLTGSDSSKSKKKKNTIGPFDSVFGYEYEPPELDYESPLESTPTIDF